MGILTQDLPLKVTMIDRAAENLGHFATHLVLALVLLVVTFWASRVLARLVHRMLTHFPATKDDTTLQGFVASLARYGVLIIGLIAVLHQLGIETTSIIAVLGAASLAVGLALQGTLSNLAAGVMILIFRPYRVGERVTVAGKTGQVKKLDLFNLELTDDNGLKIVIPNGKGFADVIVNHSDVQRQRIFLSFSLGHGQDWQAALALLKKTLDAETRLLPDPAPKVSLTSVDNSGVALTLIGWTDVSSHDAIAGDLLSSAKAALDQAGFQPPAPPVSS